MSETKSASIVWLGEGKGGPEENEWNGITFKVGEAVDVTDQRMIAKAKNNRFYEVDGVRSDDRPPTDDSDHAGDALDDMKVADLRALADQRGIPHDGLSKSQLREALRA